MAGLAFAVTAGLGVLAVNIGLGTRSNMGMVGALAFGVLSGLASVVWIWPAATAAWSVFCGQAHLALLHRTPLRLIRFLEDARERQVLRTVGPVYQFRHAKLQDRLAARWEDNQD